MSGRAMVGTLARKARQRRVCIVRQRKERAGGMKIAVIGGDGTGPEVVAEGLKVLGAVAEKVGFMLPSLA